MQEMYNRLAAILEALNELVKNEKEALAVLKAVEANTRK